LVKEAKDVFAEMDHSLRENVTKLEAMLQDIYQSEPSGASSENLIAFEMLAETFKKLESPSLLSTMTLVVIPISHGSQLSFNWCVMLLVQTWNDANTNSVS
jgi:hypothetical protein